MNKEISIFKVGDTVYSPKGKGEIIRINPTANYPVVVVYEGNTNHVFEYTLDGKYYIKDIHPSLSFTPYHQHISLERPKQKYRPYENIEEAREALAKTVVRKREGEKEPIGIQIIHGITTSGFVGMGSFKVVFERYTFEDGSPIGVLEN